MISTVRCLRLFHEQSNGNWGQNLFSGFGFYYQPVVVSRIHLDVDNDDATTIANTNTQNVAKRLHRCVVRPSNNTRNSNLSNLLTLTSASSFSFLNWASNSFCLSCIFFWRVLIPEGPRLSKIIYRFSLQRSPWSLNHLLLSFWKVTTGSQGNRCRRSRFVWAEVSPKALVWADLNSLL